MELSRLVESERGRVEDGPVVARRHVICILDEEEVGAGGVEARILEAPHDLHAFGLVVLRRAEFGADVEEALEGVPVGEELDGRRRRLHLARADAEGDEGGGEEDEDADAHSHVLEEPIEGKGRLEELAERWELCILGDPLTSLRRRRLELARAVAQGGAPTRVAARAAQAGLELKVVVVHDDEAGEPRHYHQVVDEDDEAGEDALKPEAKAQHAWRAHGESRSGSGVSAAVVRTGHRLTVDWI